MDKQATKRSNNIIEKKNKKPKIECNYGENCFRKNPHHFKEYSHRHLEKILDNHSGGDFDIPESLNFQKDVIKQQLAILTENNIYTKMSTAEGEEAASVRKEEPNVRKEESNVKKEEPKPEKSPSVDNKEKPKRPDTLNTTGSSKGGQSAEEKKKIEDFFAVVAPKGGMAEKHAQAAPYYLFYTTITSSPATHSQPLSITFQELLDHSLGKLQSSLQINFMVDVGWLLAHYYFAGYNDKPLTILYGEESDDLRTISRKKPNVQAHLVPMKNAFGKHHTKMSILVYEDGSLRVVVSTANLYMDDWENRTQGLWISPKCPKLPSPVDPSKGESKTEFKRSLISYLSAYSMACLSPFIENVKQADFSAINVFLVASVPGGHSDFQWGLGRMGTLLSKHCKIPPEESDRWDLIVQASSIGSYGKEPKLWLTGDFQNQLCRSTQLAPLHVKRPSLRFIYPSLKAVRHSHDNLLGGGCLPYSNTVHVKQTWLNGFLHEWSAKHSHRNRAMPHMKSYLRLSPDHSMAAFLLLTSANISKSAWGVFNKGNGALRINSYEVGVLFLPSFVTSQNYFSVMLGDPDRLPIPYDLPPVPYTSDKVPWVMEYLHQ